jgi:hypothetical protein
VNVRVLLDENMAVKLRLALSQFETATVRYMGFAGLKNGELLNAAELAGFDVLITGDKTLEYEQNLRGRNISVVALSAPHWPLVQPYIGRIVLAIEAATPGSFTRVECGTFNRRRPKREGPSPG